MDATKASKEVATSVLAAKRNEAPTATKESPPSKKRATEDNSKLKDPLLPASTKKDDKTGLSLSLEWVNYESRDETKTNSVVVENGVALTENPGGAIKNHPLSSSEWQERCYTLSLSEKEPEKQLGSLHFVWWEDSMHANLMNLNQRSMHFKSFLFA